MADLLPQNATPIERAIAAVGGERHAAVPVGLIRDIHNPGVCPSAILPWAAWAVNAPWPRQATEALRRAHIKTSLRRSRLKGTLEGLRWAARDAGAELVKAITPPAKQFAAPALTVAERNAFLSKYPQLRIYRHRTPGQRGHVSFAVGHAQQFLIQSDAALRIAPRIYLFREGAETELTALERTVTTAAREAITVLETHQPGRAGHHAFAARFPRWPGATDAAARIHTLRLAEAYNDQSETMRRTTVTPGLDPLDVRPDEVAQPGALDSLIPGRAFVGAKSAANAARGFLAQSSARQRLYQRIYLFDPAVAVARRGAGLHVGQGVLGMPAHHAELGVRITGKVDVQRWFGRYVRGHLVATGKAHLSAALESMRDAARLSDRIAIRTTLRRVPRAGEQYTAGTLVAGAIIQTR